METKSCSARSLGANDFSQRDFVQNILKKALAHFQRKRMSAYMHGCAHTQAKGSKKGNCMFRKMKRKPVIYVYMLYTCAICNKVNVVCEL